jgi:hypothetical protein
MNGLWRQARAGNRYQAVAVRPVHRCGPVWPTNLYVEQRLPMTEIGRRYGVTDRAVAKWLTAAGIVPRARARTP